MGNANQISSCARMNEIWMAAERRLSGEKNKSAEKEKVRQALINAIKSLLPTIRAQLSDKPFSTLKLSEQDIYDALQNHVVKIVQTLSYSF